MQFSKYMKLPQVFNLSCNPLKADLQTLPPNHLKQTEMWSQEKKNNNTFEMKSWQASPVYTTAAFVWIQHIPTS